MASGNSERRRNRNGQSSRSYKSKPTRRASSSRSSSRDSPAREPYQGRYEEETRQPESSNYVNRERLRLRREGKRLLSWSEKLAQWKRKLNRRDEVAVQDFKAELKAYNAAHEKHKAEVQQLFPETREPEYQSQSRQSRSSRRRDPSPHRRAYSESPPARGRPARRSRPSPERRHSASPPRQEVRDQPRNDKGKGREEDDDGGPRVIPIIGGFSMEYERRKKGQNPSRAVGLRFKGKSRIYTFQGDVGGFNPLNIAKKIL